MTSEKTKRPTHAVQAVCTVPGSAQYGHTVTLWTGQRRSAGTWLARLSEKHAATHRHFAIVDLSDPQECDGEEPIGFDGPDGIAAERMNDARADTRRD